MGRRKKLPLIENLEIIDIAAEGKAIGKHNDMVIFVPWLVPGDIADVQVNRKKKKFMEAYATKIHTYSSERTEAFCEHFGVCGGCKWQSLPYDLQLHYKQKQVVDNLTRIGKVNVENIKPIIPSKLTQFYRNKMEYTFSATRWLSDEEVASEDEITDRNALGFHVPGKFDRVIDLNHCYLQEEFSDILRLAVRKYAIDNELSFYHQRANQGFLRNLIVRNSNLDERMVIVVFGSNDMDKITPMMQYIKDSFKQITSLMYVVNEKLNDTIGDLEINLFEGRDHIFEEMEGLRFKIGPKSFFQTNSTQALELYKITRDFADLKSDELVYDLYTGTGTIANFVATQCKKVIGLEYVEDAIKDAKINSEINKIDNTDFFAGDMKDVLNNDFIQKHGRPDVIITDPPRAGMHGDVIKVILDAAPERIIYVSCNPATQARDLELLSHKYELMEVQPVDMFPHTHHVENVVKLVIKK